MQSEFGHGQCVRLAKHCTAFLDIVTLLPVLQGCCIVFYCNCDKRMYGTDTFSLNPCDQGICSHEAMRLQVLPEINEDDLAIVRTADEPRNVEADIEDEAGRETRQ